MPSVHKVLGLLLCVVVAGNAQAGVLRLEPSRQNVDSGESFLLQLFFDEQPGDFGTGTGDDTGLISAAFRLFVQESQLPLVTVNSISRGPQFSIPGSVFLPGDTFPPQASDPPVGESNLLGLSQAIGLFDPPATPTNGEILLAEISMTIKAPVGTTVLFKPSTFSPPFDGFVGDKGTVYDINLGDPIPAEVTVTGVVPEPGSMLIWAGLVGAPLLVRRRRRKLVAKA
jgi:hypothetical protein